MRGFSPTCFFTTSEKEASMSDIGYHRYKDRCGCPPMTKPKNMTYSEMSSLKKLERTYCVVDVKKMYTCI